MSNQSFSSALRAELDAVVSRYEALVCAHNETLSALREQKNADLQKELHALAADHQKFKARVAELEEEKAELVLRVSELVESLEHLEKELQAAREQAELSKEKARAADLAAMALQSTFSGEIKFIEACKGLSDTLLLEALQSVLGDSFAFSAEPQSYGVLKQKGLDHVLSLAFRERGRKAASAPLLSREQAAISALADAAGCELVLPKMGERFSPSSMEKVKTVSEPSEEGNVVDCAMPGLRLAGSEGALVLPKVVVAIA